ncbi:hypothetical protein LXL04_015350 [Taraxacum kok-saghyz]
MCFACVFQYQWLSYQSPFSSPSTDFHKKEFRCDFPLFRFSILTPSHLCLCLANKIQTDPGYLDIWDYCLYGHLLQLVHGLLHLFGYDHELSEEAEAEMEEEEERLLKNLGWKGKGLIQSALIYYTNKINRIRGCLICTDRVRHQTTDRVRHQTTDRVRHQNTDQTPRTDIRPRTESEITGKNSVCDFFGWTESEAKRRTESGVRVRRPLSNAQTTDRVRGPSLSLWSELISNTP